MRLNPKKRPLALVDMMQRLTRLLEPARRVELRIAGDGPWRARVERAIARGGLTQQIHLLGRQSREQIRALFARATSSCCRPFVSRSGSRRSRLGALDFR